jgi:hypothetical protein
VVLLKENHTQLIEAAALDGKSGEAEGSAVRHSCAPPYQAKDLLLKELLRILGQPVVTGYKFAVTPTAAPNSLPHEDFSRPDLFTDPGRRILFFEIRPTGKRCQKRKKQPR